MWYTNNTMEHINEIISEQELNTKVSVLNVIEGTSVDGVGLRTSIYFAGCCHHCEGCHNPHSWDITNGNMVSIRELIEVIRENDFNVTFSGGDPLYQIKEVTILAKAIKQMLGKTIWCYTGYIYEDIKDDTKYAELLSNIDVLVDGPFKLNLRDTSLPFRGSSNQRIIYLQNQ